MRILITGGSGVIAPYLKAKLESQGHEVRTFDLIGGDIIGDVTDSHHVNGALNSIAPDRIYHLAAHVGREHSEHKSKVLDVNVTGTYNVAMACAERDIEMVNFSTSEVYGNHVGIAVDEKARCDPVNLYGVSKLAAEDIVNYQVRVYGLKAMTIRPFMIYGGEPDSIWRSALSRFFYGIRDRRAIDIYASCLRSWCYVSDLVNGVTSEFIEGTFNIGNDTEPLTMLELYYKQTAIVGYWHEPNIIYDDPNIITVANKAAKFGKAKEQLGYKPSIGLMEGLSKTWEASHGCTN